MNKQIENIRRTREYTIDVIKELSLEKLNKIPTGFNNNILWNLGHLVAAQQSICYTKGGLLPALPESAYADFKPGTRPVKFFEADVEDDVKSMMISAVDSLQIDYQKNNFLGFVPWTNRYGNVLQNIDEAIAYLQFHEGLHLGVIMSLKKLVSRG